MTRDIERNQMNDFKLSRTRRYASNNDFELNENQESLIENNNFQNISNEISKNAQFKNYFRTKFTLNRDKIRKILEETQINNDTIYNEILNINKPQETDFSQQRLNAWKPILTPKFVINLFLICSILFLPIGIILYFNSNNIYEAIYDYTECSDFGNQSYTCHDQLLKNVSYNCVCRLFFSEDNFQDETLYVYYMLDNYYQNIRQYVRSVDSNQLLNKLSDKDLAIECEPFRYKIDRDVSKRKYEPCGAIANSLFNESVNSVKPPNWNNQLSQSQYLIEDLMVWMRTSAFPSFRKLYGRILPEENQKLEYKIDKTSASIYKFLRKFEKNDSFLTNDTDYMIKISKYFKPVKDVKIMRLPKGKYSIDIDYRYMVKQFNGRKYLVLANVSWLGGKCYFMAWAYIIVGILCFITAIVLFFFHVYFGNIKKNCSKLNLL